MSSYLDYLENLSDRNLGISNLEFAYLFSHEDHQFLREDELKFPWMPYPLYFDLLGIGTIDYNKFRQIYDHYRL